MKFVVAYHGSQNHMATQSEWSKWQYRFLALTKKSPNVWYATPETTAPWRQLGYDRFFVWPNTMPFETPLEPPPVIDPPAILISGRKCMTKAHPAGVLAAALITRQRPIRLLGAIKDSAVQTYKDLAAAAGIPMEFVGWKTQIQFRRWLRQHVSVTIQATLTDSFNYLALDSLSRGRPVVGSSVIRYLPKQWQADPNDPADIARIAVQILDDYGACSQEALRLAAEIRDRQREAYQAAIARILRDTAGWSGD